MKVIRARPSQEIQGKRARIRATKWDATPISATESSNPAAKINKILTRGTGDRQDVVERHGNIGEHNLHAGLRKRFGDRHALGFAPPPGAGSSDLPEELPGHPKQQNAAGKGKPDDRQDLKRQGGKSDAQDGGGADPPKDGLAALLGREPGGSQADDDGVVAREHQVDEHDLGKQPELVDP